MILPMNEVYTFGKFVAFLVILLVIRKLFLASFEIRSKAQAIKREGKFSACPHMGKRIFRKNRDIVCSDCKQIIGRGPEKE